MNQNRNWDKCCAEICQKIIRAIGRIARGGQAPNSAQSEANTPVKALDIQSKPEGGRRITLVLENGEGKSSTSDFPDNKVVIVAARTEPVKIPGHPVPGQSAKRAAVTGPVLPVQGPGREKTRRGSNTVESVSEDTVKVTHGERAHKPKLESTLRVDQESKRSDHDSDHRFSDYINRTWLRLRTVSNVGGGKDHSPAKDPGHDHFADYIAGAKKKLKTTPGIGGGDGRDFSSK